MDPEVKKELEALRAKVKKLESDLAKKDAKSTFKSLLGEGDIGSLKEL